MSTVRSGWLEKQSGTIFKSWKRKYAVLYRDGEFSLYENPNDATAEVRVHMKKDCKDISIGFECGCTNLPKGQSSIDALFCIKTRGGKEIYLAAATDGECREWVGILQQARRDETGFRQTVAQAPPADAPPSYEQNAGGVRPVYAPRGPPPTGYAAQPMQGPYPYPPQPGVMYVRQPMYMAQPGYGPQPYPVQQQQTSDNSTRNMFLGAAAGGLAGYAVGSMLTHSFHHDYGYHGGYDHGGFDSGGFDSGGFDGGGFDGGGFDF